MKYLPVIVIAGLAAACQPLGAAPETASASATPPAFATAVCAQCHAIGAAGISPNPESPPFAEIVNREGLTRETLASFLRDAHNYPDAMQFYLDAPMTEQLVDYMMTLKDADYHKEI